MSNDRYECIRQALAMGPTPWPWEVIGLSGYGGPYALRMQHPSGRTWYGVDGIKRREDAEYFVACDPDTIRELLEERDALREVLQELVNWFPSADMYLRLGFDPKTPMQVLNDAKTVLFKEVSSLSLTG